MASSIDSPGAGVPRHRALVVNRCVAATTMAALFVCAQVFGADAIGELGVICSMALAAWIAFRADMAYLPALLLLYLPHAGINTREEEATIGGGLVFTEAVRQLEVAGIEVHVPLVVSTIAAARIAMVLWRRGNTVRRSVPILAVSLWLTALVPAVVGALEGRAAGYNRWSIGVRALLTLGGSFWGALALPRRPDAADSVIRRIPSLTVVGAILLTVGVLRGHLVFVLLGLLGGCTVWFVRERQWAFLVLVVTALGSSAHSLTLTMMGTTALGAILAAIGCWVHKPLRRGAVVAVGVTAVLLPIGLVGIVLTRPASEVMALSDVVVATQSQRLPLQVRVVAKLVGDRGPLWRSAANQLREGPYLIRAAGRPLPEIPSKLAGEEGWEFGAHNSVLELLLHAGLLAGAIGLLVAGLALYRSLSVIASTPSPLAAALASGAASSVIVGMATGNYPVYEQVGFILWALVGAIVAHADRLVVRH